MDIDRFLSRDDSYYIESKEKARELYFLVGNMCPSWGCTKVGTTILYDNLRESDRGYEVSIDFIDGDEYNICLDYNSTDDWGDSIFVANSQAHCNIVGDKTKCIPVVKKDYVAALIEAAELIKQWKNEVVGVYGK